MQSLPDLSDIIAGKANIDELRDVDVGDLLGRDAVPPNPKLVESCIRNKCVMVTGAGGSIGSELCRQILRLAPRRLVLFEMSELALYNIQRELNDLCISEKLAVEILPLLGNAHHRHRVREVIGTCGVQTIYHAAAYKHVPIVEHNVVEGIHNNVISTWYTAEAALESGVETFVLISTDKAVNPANVMGATKRLAELVLQALQERSSTTRFCMVRFGNVLASSGSVVPLSGEQIRRGGPVTVTHPDVIRYFMTILEAAQLVIQAGSMAKGGDVFVLDMGRPVRIDDLARRMISLMGLHGARRRESGRRHRDRIHRPAHGGEAVRGIADRHQRHRHRSPDDHARHRAFAALGPHAAAPERVAGGAQRASTVAVRWHCLPRAWRSITLLMSSTTTSGPARPCRPPQTRAKWPISPPSGASPTRRSNPARVSTRAETRVTFRKLAADEAFAAHDLLSLSLRGRSPSLCGQIVR